MSHEPYDPHVHGPHDGYPGSEDGHGGAYGEPGYPDPAYGGGYTEADYGEADYTEANYGAADYGVTGYPADATPAGYHGHEAEYDAAYDRSTHAHAPVAQDRHSHHTAPAPGSWGGEYDSDATGFIQLPGPGSGSPGADPLAAPGTGQGGYTPPSLADFEPGGATAYTEQHLHGGHGGFPEGAGVAEAANGAPMTPEATTDPSSTGQWTMPFAAAAATDPADFGGGAGHGVEALAGQAVVDSVTPAATPATGAGDDAGPALSVPRQGGVGPAAAALGQGAAAALAGSHEARTQRRPLGVGGAAGRTETAQADADGAGPAVAPDVPQLPDLPGAPDPGHAGAGQQAPHVDAQARRQVPFAGTPTGDVAHWPEPGVLSAAGPSGGPGEGAPGPSAHHGGPVDPHPEPHDTVSPSSAIPYADSTPGGEAPLPGAGHDAPQHPGPVPGNGTPAAPTWPGPGVPAGTDGAEGTGLAPADTSSAPEPAAPGMPWPDPAAGDPPVAGPPAVDLSAAETPAAGRPVAEPSEPASAARPAGRVGSPPSKIPFVESTPGAAARAAASTPAAVDGDTPPAAPGAPADSAGHIADETRPAEDPSPSGAVWPDAPSGPGPDDSGEYLTAPAADPAGAATGEPHGRTEDPSSSAAPEEEATGPPVPEFAASRHSDHPHVSYVLRVNGVDRPVADAWIGESLLYVLRERLGLAGAKDGCSQGECGACSVQVDGRLVASCLVPAATAAGSEVRTVEGLARDGAPSDVQRALAACGAVQCGFCVPGLAMAVHELLEGNHAPTELETRQAVCGNLCRCSGYRGVLDAVETVVSERSAQAEQASPEGDQAP
jgi:aerobic-type carbon monoxide dehydrogenase small subunit (CoxS/CutS family)